MNQSMFILVIGVMIGIGIGIMALVGADPIGADSMGHFEGGVDRRQPYLHADTQLLDYLEKSEYHVFFNDTVDAGMWGVLDADNHLVAAGSTVRSAIHRAKERDTLAGIDALEAALAQNAG